MSGSSLSTKVLEAGGHIESRCLIKNLPNFTEQYVFDKESLERLLRGAYDECAYTADIALLGHERSIRDRVVNAIRAKVRNESV
jgi:hypothetical protein